MRLARADRLRFVPKFVRRRWLVHRIERAWRDGDARLAARLAADPLAAATRAVTALGSALAPALERTADDAAARGDEPALADALALLEPLDRERAARARERLLPREPQREALVDLLARMRAEREAAASPPPESDGAAIEPPRAASVRDELATLARVSIDDAGEYLVACGRSVLIGHARAHDVDLPFLGDVDLHHARLVLADAFHEGSRWRLDVVRPGGASIGGRALAQNGIALADGDRVDLARNVGFVLRSPEEGSASVVLDLARGAECRGTSKVLLLATGPEGRVRIGSRRSRHVVVTDLEHDVTLEIVSLPTRLRVSCEGGVALAGGAELSPALEIDWPLREPVRVRALARRAAGIPFEIALSPVAPAMRVEHGPRRA